MAKKYKLKKATNKILDFPYLIKHTEALKNAGYDKPKWVIFCETMIRDGYTVILYEARQTVSKYITISLNGMQPFKVRFSNHRPIHFREARGDCDFFVGHTNLGITNTGQAITATRHHFATQQKGII